MIEKVIVKKALKADRFYYPGEILLPPFSTSIMAEIKAGRETLDIYFKDCRKEKDIKKNQTIAVQPVARSPVQSIEQVDELREILFRKFDRLEIANSMTYRPKARHGTSPSWFLGRYAPRKRNLLFRKFERLAD